MLISLSIFASAHLLHAWDLCSMQSMFRLEIDRLIPILLLPLFYIHVSCVGATFCIVSNERPQLTIDSNSQRCFWVRILRTLSVRCKAALPQRVDVAATASMLPPVARILYCVKSFNSCTIGRCQPYSALFRLSTYLSDRINQFQCFEI